MKPIPDYRASVAEQLKAQAEKGQLRTDAAQMAVAQQLDVVLSALKGRNLAAKSSALGWMFAQKRNKPEKPRGLYIHGSVGRGKTMLMDMFFDLAPGQSKRRAHFHVFMADVHARVHAHRQAFKAGETKQADPIPPVAKALFEQASLLCFDEFSVSDITDAMILSRLFGELFSLGCVLVATSNVAPDDLYRDGLNRDLFLPFVSLLKQYVTVTTLDSRTDYRLEKTRSLPVYYEPLGQKADAAMDAAFALLTEGETATPRSILMRGRAITVPLAARGVARFSFADLCEAPLGASDYIEIARQFPTVLVDNIPFLSPEKRNETKRFIILIDALYDNGNRLFASAAAMPEKLLSQRKGTEGFEFDRTVSRLFEMRSQDYLEAALARVAGDK
jgi:cell division protein ZapE